MKKYFWLVALLAVVFFFPSCEKEQITEEPPVGLVAPDIPPMAMFVMPTEDFDQAMVDTSQSAPEGGRGVTFTYQNWFHSAINLVVWHTIVTVNMALPTAAFAAAAQETPEYIGNLTFEWDYTYVAPPGWGGHTYYVVLTGQLTPDYTDVLWTMTVSQEGGFQDFVWYTGITSTELPEGEFTLYRFPNNPQEYLRLDYLGDEATGYGALRFTNIIPGSDEFGQYIEYREEPGATLDRAFDVQGAPGNFLQIQWNELLHFGRVKHPLHFGDAEWHCWDENYVDVDCN